MSCADVFRANSFFSALTMPVHLNRVQRKIQSMKYPIVEIMQRVSLLAHWVAEDESSTLRSENQETPREVDRKYGIFD